MTPSSIFDALSDPQMRHAAMVHMPIALAFLGLLPAALALIGRLGRTPVVITLVIQALLIAAAWGGVLSGEAAQGQTGGLAPEIRTQIHDHEESAEKIWYFALAAGLVGLGGLARPGRFATIAKVTTLVAITAGAGWTAYAAHLGGSLVYDFGVGTPNPVMPEPAAPEPGSDEAESLGGDGDLSEPAPEGALTLDPNADPRAVFFVSTVHPILVDQCMGCHTVGEDPDADLDLSTPAGLLAGGRSGPVVFPGDPAASSLYTTLTGEHPDIDRMPKGGDPLLDEEIEALRQWIEQGAVWAPMTAAADRDG